MQSFLAKKLFSAIESGDDDEVLRLLDAGADPNARHPDQCPESSFTPLHLACVLGKEKVVDFLLAKGAFVDSICYYDSWNSVTPLHLAATKNHANIIRTLLAAGADYKLQDIRGNTALDAAARHNSLASLRVLLVPVASDGFSKNRALVSAIRLESVQATKILLRAGADPNNMGDLSYTPLHFALMFRARRNADMLEIIDLLLISGANVEAGGPIGLKPLAFAVMQSLDSAIISRLIAAGADIHARDSLGWTALHEAIVRCDCDNVQVLLNAGARPQLAWTFRFDRSRDSEFSVLHLLAIVDEDRGIINIKHRNAYIERISATLNLLVAAGADLNARTTHGVPLTSDFSSVP